MITTKQAIDLLKSAYEFEVEKGGRCCGKTNFRTALLMGANALGVLEQVRWERDVAVSQLNELGLSLGQKVDHVKELIDKNTENEAIDKSKNPTDWHIMHCPTCDRIFWNSGQFMHYEPKYCEKCGQKMLWKKNPYSVG